MPRVDLDGLSPRDVDRVAGFAAELRGAAAHETGGGDAAAVTAFTRARRPYPAAPPSPCPAPAALPSAQIESDSQIRNALSYSEELAAQLHSEIASIEHRLEPGLTPDAPTPTDPNTCGQSVPCRSQVLERVGGLNAALVQGITRLRDVRLRVEL